MMDMHCHIDLYEDPASVAAEIARRKLFVLSVTTTPTAWSGTKALAPVGSRMRTALGIHPQLVQNRAHEIEVFERLFPDARYIGEVGLDGGAEYAASWGCQVELFSRILALCARDGGRVITIHSRRASAAVIDCIERAGHVGLPILHWFSGTKAQAERATQAGCWFSVGPAMLDGARGRQLVAHMPRERVLLETDGPFGRLGDRTLFPWDAANCIPILAEVWATTEANTAKILANNLEELARIAGMND